MFFLKTDNSYSYYTEVIYLEQISILISFFELENNSNYTANKKINLDSEYHSQK